VQASDWARRSIEPIYELRGLHYGYLWWVIEYPYRDHTVRAFFAEADNDQVTIDYDSGQTSAKKLAAIIPAHYGVTLISDKVIP